MKITVEFESWEEMESFRNPGASSTVKTQTPEPQPAAQEDMVSQPEEKPAEPAEDPQDLMVKARQLLADVNKATGMNKAKEIINGLGYERFINVPADHYADLIAAAEKELKELKGNA